MRLFHGTDNAEIARPTVLTLGVFDGLHLGHQLIMQTVVERARALGAVPTVITLSPIRAPFCIPNQRHRYYRLSIRKSKRWACWASNKL